jgi:hypothetical protein
VISELPDVTDRHRILRRRRLRQLDLEPARLGLGGGRVRGRWRGGCGGGRLIAGQGRRARRQATEERKRPANTEDRKGVPEFAAGKVGYQGHGGGDRLGRVNAPVIDGSNPIKARAGEGSKASRGDLGPW